MPEYRCPFCLKKFRKSSDLTKHLIYGNCQSKKKKGKRGAS